MARAAALAVACLLFAPPVFAPPPAHAKGDPIVVTINSITTTGVDPSSTVTIKATIRNTSGADVHGVQAMLWRSRDPITDLSTLRAVPTTIAGWGATLPLTSTHYVSVTTPSTPFPAGASRNLTLSATLTELDYSTWPAAYPIGVRVISQESSASVSQLVGQARTFVLLPGDAAVPVTPVVVLDAAPTKIMTDVFANDSLRTELSGRLDVLLAAVERGEASYLVDPALLDEVTDLADGYTVRGNRGDAPGAGQAVAAAWIARFRALPSAEGARTLFANPDLTSDAAGRLAREASASAESIVSVSHLPLVALTATGVMTNAVATSLTDAAPAAILAVNLNRDDPVQTAGLKAATVAIAATPFGADAGAPAQDLLARAFVGHGQVRIIRDADGLTLNSAAWAPWARRTPLTDLLRMAPAATSGYAEAPTPALDQTQRATLRQATLDIPLYDEVVADAPLRDAEDAVLTRLASSSWIGADGQAAYANAVTGFADARALRRDLKLNVSPRVVMSSKQNEFPVTVTNGMAAPVSVKIVTTTDNPDLVVPDSDVIDIPPGVSQTINMRPEATTNGVTIAYVTVASADGLSVTGQEPVTIEVTDLGFIVWIIVVASGALLVGATAFRVRQVARGQVRHPVKDAPDADPLPANTAPPAKTADPSDPPARSENPSVRRPDDLAVKTIP